ncbi:MAG: PAS domain S-box protein [Sphingobacteriaceae bacterium]|nr:MAG: PAS domain S-box protein [Sphingobacteriaceae bacterium]
MNKEQQSKDIIETKRLQALSSYHVLDTLPEKEYDSISRLASYICQVPIALITLIDEDRQWIKSKVGLDISETSRADSFCQYTILHNEILEIKDTLEDDRFKDNPFVKGEAHIRFYAGAPLIDPEGHKIGSLCVIDTVPRKLSSEQKDALHTLASQVMSHLVLKKQKEQLENSLRQHEDFYQLFNVSPEIHYIADANSNIEIISDAVKDILGYEPKDTIGKSLWDYVVDNNREQFVPLIEKAVATQHPFYLETQVLTANNKIKWIGWSAIYKAGKWYASGRDITYQKNILAELEQLSLVASKMINGVVVSDANDNVVWTNQAFENITGYTFDEVVGKRLRYVLDDDANGVEVYQELIAKKQSYSIQIHVLRKNGERIWLSLVNSVIKNDAGEVEKYIRLLVDITDIKKAQKDLEILSFAARKAPVGMLTRNNQNEVVWMNEAAEQITGYTLDEMKGRSFGNMLVGDGTDMTLLNEAVKAREENRPFDIELLIYKKDGTPVWVASSNSPLFNDSGYVERQVSIMSDITERKYAEDQLKLLSLVASNTNSGVVINNSRGEIEWVNNAFTNITGYTFDDVNSKHLGDVLQGELTDATIIEKARELTLKKQSFEVDLLAYKKDGKPVWLTVINSVILNNAGEVEKYIEIIIDISARKGVEQKLVAAKEEAQQLNRAKDMFISVMSHEIRTPLNAVIGMSRLLSDEEHLPNQEENLNVLKFSAQSLMALINDVLDFTKIETGNVELEKADVNLRSLVKGIISSMQYKVAEKGITLTSNIDKEIPEIVVGDSTRLSQILLNLVSNAIKFTDTGGVSVKLKVVEKNEKNVKIRFYVNDTGIGIASNKLNTIFESFKQAEADTTRKYGGTGLGLAISKRLVELHNSKIYVDSVKDNGSTFWFTITFNTSNNEKNNTDKVDTTLDMKVLVVDDNQINRLLINKILTKWGVKTEFAENGVEALEKVEATPNYDVILMDLNMPKMGGLEATEALRAKPDPYYKQVHIIALTASILNPDAGEIGEMDDYILKPFEPAILFEKLSKLQSSN